MGIRFLFLIFAVFAIWLIIRFYWKSGKTIEQSHLPKIKTDNIVACHYCGLHIPLAEAHQSDGRYFCSKEHAQKSNDS